jgi:hypothetical protein
MTRHPALARLDDLVGEWDMTVEGAALSGGTTSFEWVEKGAFLRSFADAEIPEGSAWAGHAPFPVVVMIGLDQLTGRFSYLYADGRDVHRVYEMSFEDGDWRIWGRPGADWCQRFIGTLADDRNRIDARWERSSDGDAWELDFELTYLRR